MEKEEEEYSESQDSRINSELSPSPSFVHPPPMGGCVLRE